MTLVIDRESIPLRSLWAVMDIPDLAKAKEALRVREGARNTGIGSWSPGQTAPDSIPTIAEWATAHGVNGVIWTALPAKSPGDSDAPDTRPSVEVVIEHLRGLEGAKRDNAERYIRRTPRQIDTAYRRRIEAELGWTPLDRWRA